MLDTPLLKVDYSPLELRVLQHRERVWNALVPPSVIKAEVRPYGVAYLHPTKGWKSVGKKRFAIRGVM